MSNSGSSLLPFLKVSLSQNFPNNLDHRLFSIQQCLSIRQCLALSVLCPAVPMSVQPYPNCFHLCSALSIRCPAVPSCVKVSVSVQFCPDRVRGVQHCLAVFSSIQHRPAVFCCLVVPSCSTVSNSGASLLPFLKVSLSQNFQIIWTTDYLVFSSVSPSDSV